MFKKILLLCLSTLILSVHLDAKPNYGGTLVFVRGGDASSMDPSLVSDGETFIVTENIYDGLVQFEPGTTKLIPALATKWESSKDGLEYTFTLRKGVKFSKTKHFKKTPKFTADDVIFSLKRQLKNSAIQKKYYKKKSMPFVYWAAMDMNNIIKDIIKINDYKVKFVLHKPEAPFVANLAMSFSAILSKDYADFLLKKYGKIDRIAKKPVGTGAFVFNKWVKDDKVILKANKKYWDGKPYLKKLIIKVIPNNSVRAAQLKTGSAHVMSYPNPEEIPALKKHKDLKVLDQEGFNIGYVAFNTKKKPFDNKLVRQAINMAINKKAIVKAIYGDFGVVAKNPIPPTAWSYNEDIIDYKYDVKKAKKLLADAGYKNGFETTLWAMPVARPYNPNAKKVAEAMQADLKKVGIKAKIVSYDWGTYLKKTKNGEHDMAMLGWTGDNGDPDNFLYVLLSKAAAKKPAQNIALWEHDEFDRLLNQAKVLSDIKERTKLYEKAQVIFKKEAPWLTIAHSVVVTPVRKNVMGFKIYPTSVWKFHKVWLKK